MYTQKKLNLEQLTKALGVPVSATGELHLEGPKVVLAEVPPEVLQAAVDGAVYDPDYRGTEDPDYPVPENPIDLSGTEEDGVSDPGDARPRVVTKKAVNPEQLTKLLGVAVSTSGNYAEEGEETIVVAEGVTQEKLEQVMKSYKHDPDYRGHSDPDYPLPEVPVEGRRPGNG